MTGAQLAVLLQAMILVESGGDPAAVGDGGRALGVLQVHAAVVAEVNGVYGFRVLPDGTVVAPGHERHGDGRPYRHADMRDPRYARHACVHYLRHWGREYRRSTGREPTPEVLARIWNGGPQGWRKSATEGYWRRVRALL